MSFLKKFGIAALKIFGVISGFAPQIGSLLPPGAAKSFSDVFNRIVAAVQMTEVVIGAVTAPDVKTGPDKLKAAAVLVAQIVQTSEIVAGKKINNEALFSQAVTKITDGVADLLNSLEDKVHVTQTQDLPPVAYGGFHD